MAILDDGAQTIVRNSVLYLTVPTIPGDVVEMFRDGTYLGRARRVGDTDNFVFPIRMPDNFQSYIYSARIKRGGTYSPRAQIEVVLVENLPFLRDYFNGADGTFIHDHAPDIGSTWIRKYDIDNAYAYDDNNFAISAGNGLRQADFNGSLNERWVWNEVVPPSANYRITATFVLGTVSNYLELALFARGDGTDAIRGYIQWMADAEIQPQISALSEGNAGFGGSQLQDISPGEHVMELVVIGDQATLNLDGGEVQTRTLPTPLGGAGTVGFAFRSAGDLEEVTLSKIETFAL